MDDMQSGVRDPAKYAETNRLFQRTEQAAKLYTERYVKKLKATHRSIMNKFTAGTNYAMRAQKKQIMYRASRLVIDSHKRIIETF